MVRTEDTPIWITEYAHETLPPERLGIDPELQARYMEEALQLAAENPRLRVFVWFVFRDRSDGLWQSGLLWEDSTPKPALATFAAAARRLDGRHPVLPEGVEVARVPALELAHYVPTGTPVDVTVDGAQAAAVPLEQDGWLEVPLNGPESDELDLRATDPHGHSVSRTVRIGPEAIELD